MRRRTLPAAGWALLATLCVVGTWTAPACADEATPSPGTPADEDPPLEGEAKKQHQKALSEFDKRYKAVKNADELIQFLNELDAAGTRAARDWLIQYAKTVKSARWREMAFASLAKIGGSTAIGFLCGKSGVRSPEAFVQRQAVDALAKAADKRSVGPLLDVVSDPALKMETVAAACLALAKIDPADDKVRETLRKVTEDRRDTVRAAAFEALGHGADDASFALLLEALQKNKNATVRAGAAAGLGHAGRAEAIPALKAAVAGEKSQPVRAAAIQALQTLGATPD